MASETKTSVHNAGYFNPANIYELLILLGSDYFLCTMLLIMIRFSALLLINALFRKSALVRMCFY